MVLRGRDKHPELVRAIMSRLEALTVNESRYIPDLIRAVVADFPHWKQGTSRWVRRAIDTMNMTKDMPIRVEGNYIFRVSPESRNETAVVKVVNDSSVMEELVQAKSRLDKLTLERDAIKDELEALRSGASKKAVKLAEIERPHMMFDHAFKLATARLDVMLIGPAGTGKTTLAGQIGKALKMRFSHISCSADMSVGILLGRLLPTGKGGQFEYHASEFVDFYENGGLFLIDEIDAADANVLVSINSALGNSVLSVPNRVDKPIANRHPDFVCFAAANTYGTGADRMYVGRNQLDEATLDRFRISQVELDYDPEVEEVVCPDAGIRERFLRYRANVRKASLRRVVSMRAMGQAFKAKLAGLNDAEIDAALFAGWSRDEINRVKGDA